MKVKYLLFAFAVLMMSGVAAQSSAKESMLKKKKEYSDRTMVQRFEKSMIMTAAERTELRKQNQQKRKELLVLIDTSSIIKDKMRDKLKHDAIHDPFSARLKKFVDAYKVEETPVTLAQNEK
ncbi:MULTISPECIES: hypothetical protein [Croceitalea]|uniref:DUF4890 domain-containing protein n=1 Tax=Croceitalea vernalis TaxID=3075599 RepID=A0ABU3BHD8_9FLAO|nr:MULTISPECIES: hypothetical protein [unclassified Croceitalea]MDT0539771.1 hypothetical protein [Croceitalea sp. P059]MDT0621586.1 hypothetical protein [Croceitalea sp. P007]